MLLLWNWRFSIYFPNWCVQIVCQVLSRLFRYFLSKLSFDRNVEIYFQIFNSDIHALEKILSRKNWNSQNSGPFGKVSTGGKFRMTVRNYFAGSWRTHILKIFGWESLRKLLRWRLLSALGNLTITRIYSRYQGGCVHCVISILWWYYHFKKILFSFFRSLNVSLFVYTCCHVCLQFFGLCSFCDVT
jgi:hypothetical protein